jgi:hypothetical protein
MTQDGVAFNHEREVLRMPSGHAPVQRLLFMLMVYDPAGRETGAVHMDMFFLPGQFVQPIECLTNDRGQMAF